MSGMSVPTKINKLKQDVNSKTLARKLDNSFYVFVFNHKDIEYMVDNNIELLVLNCYKIHRPYALADIIKFSEDLQIEDGSNASHLYSHMFSNNT